MERFTRGAAVLVTGALLCLSTACSSSKSSSTPSPTASTAASSTAPSSSPSSAASTPSTATLAAIAVQASDLPAGWTSQPSQPDPKEDANRAALVSCVGGRDTTPDRIAQADSPDFSQGEAGISSRAAAFKSQSDIAADTQLLASPKIDSCYATALRALLAETQPSATINSIKVAVTPGSGGGPSNVAATATSQISLTIQGQTALAYIDIAFITGPSLGVQITFSNVGQPVATAVRSAVIARVAARAAQG
jgi:hypothetical protein